MSVNSRHHVIASYLLWVKVVFSFSETPNWTWVICTWIHAKINSAFVWKWELTWWEVDLLGVGLVGVDFVRVDWSRGRTPNNELLHGTCVSMKSIMHTLVLLPRALCNTIWLWTKIIILSLLPSGSINGQDKTTVSPKLSLVPFVNKITWVPNCFCPCARFCTNSCSHSCFSFKSPFLFPAFPVAPTKPGFW